MIVCLCLDGDLITISDTSDLNLAKQRHRLLKITILSKLYNMNMLFESNNHNLLVSPSSQYSCIFKNVKVFYHLNVLTFEGLNAFVFTNTSS